MGIDIKMVEYFDDRWYKILLLKDGKPDTRWIPSVTTKLNIVAKPFLAKWRGDLGNREADMRMFESQQRGTRIHYGFNVLVNGGTIVYNPWQHPTYNDEEIEKLKKDSPIFYVVQYQDEMLQLVKLSKWIKTIKPTILGSESTVYSLKNNDAGTLDLLIDIKEGEYAVNGAKPIYLEGGSYVCDLKTGSQVGDEANWQTACYAKCVEEMGQVKKVAGTMILHTGSHNKKGIEGLSTIVRTHDDIDDDYNSYRLASSLWEKKNINATPKVFDFPSILKLN